jgi:uncharacterized protein (TIGR00106 family)
MSTLLELSMWPLGQGESVSEHVAKSLDIIEKSGLPYRLNPMGTVIEGEYDDLMAVAKACFERMARDCSRIECIMKLDYRADAENQLEGKVTRVENRLGRKLSK